ncbi:MAG TPA: PQQ-binding-like beta-propeller repeat protein, partial [Pirellulaceae bacterium]|nr:PQQ-binding-like beta-propeller repeat protein [Pirellulaceae bacterium]
MIRNAARATSLRARANVLVAYDLATGDERWRTESQSVEPSEPVVDSGFIGSPLATATRVYAPRVERGVVAIVALDAETGELLWESKLCAEPRAGCWPWSNVTLALQGADLSISTGAGVVFALDAATGGIRWGREYERAVERRRDLTLSTSNSGAASGSSGSTQAFDATLEMIAGRYRFQADAGEGRPAATMEALQPRVSWDRVNNRLVALPGSKSLALLNGGTIPDTGQYAAYTTKGVRIGELDEE